MTDELDTFKFIADARSAIRRSEESEQPLSEWLANSLDRLEKLATENARLKKIIAEADGNTSEQSQLCHQCKVGEVKG